MDDRFEEIKCEISKIFIAEDELHKVKDAMQKFQHWFMIKVIVQKFENITVSSHSEFHGVLGSNPGEDRL